MPSVATQTRPRKTPGKGNRSGEFISKAPQIAAKAKAAPPASRKRADAVMRIAKRCAGGRPPTLTAELCSRIVRYALEGNYRETCAAACGVPKRTFYDWMALAEEWTESQSESPPDPHTLLCLELAHALNCAEAQAEIGFLRVAARGEKGWVAAMTILERKYPQRWGRSEKRYHQVSGSDGKPPVIHFETDEERRERVASILADAGALRGEVKA